MKNNDDYNVSLIVGAALEAAIFILYAWGFITLAVVAARYSEWLYGRLP